MHYLIWQAATGLGSLVREADFGQVTRSVFHDTYSDGPRQTGSMSGLAPYQHLTSSRKEVGGDNPSSPLQTVQGGIERTVLHLKEIVRGPLNVLVDLVTMSKPVEKCPQDEHV